jgi:hypothetical protein
MPVIPCSLFVVRFTFHDGIVVSANLFLRLTKRKDRDLMENKYLACFRNKKKICPSKTRK